MTTPIEHIINNEAAAWQRMQEIRQAFSPELFDHVVVDSPSQAYIDAVSATHSALQLMEDIGVDFNKLDPGHGIGHLVRDYVNARIMLRKLDVNPAHLFVGFLGGVMHDLGCALVPRYDDNKRAVGHAEAGALLFDHIADELFLNKEEIILTAYAIAAHTNYLKPNKITCRDGVERTREPYQDTDAEGKPIYGVWITRWVDRLDCNGPTFVGRHYLTLAEKHADFDGKKFYETSFGQAMNPVVRTPEQITAAGGNKTMLEHMKMFADSQNNSSVYGKHDFGEMVDIRDEHKEQLNRIITSGLEGKTYGPQEEGAIVDSWTLFLKRNIEPTQPGIKAADTLRTMFVQLPPEYRQHWCHAFVQTMQEYRTWAQRKLTALEEIGEYKLPGIVDDVRKIIKPVIE